jgi:hypothetical protein
VDFDESRRREIEERSFVAALLWMTAKGRLEYGDRFEPGGLFGSEGWVVKGGGRAAALQRFLADR